LTWKVLIRILKKTSIMVKIRRKRLEKIISNHKIPKNQEFHKTRKKNLQINYWVLFPGFNTINKGLGQRKKDKEKTLGRH
jgi:hypothetical protein